TKGARSHAGIRCGFRQRCSVAALVRPPGLAPALSYANCGEPRLRRHSPDRSRRHALAGTPRQVARALALPGSFLVRGTAGALGQLAEPAWWARYAAGLVGRSARATLGRMHVTRRLGIALILAALSCVVSCRKKNTSEAQAPSGPLEPRKVTGNPFLGVALYWPPYNNADQARRRIEQAKPDEAALIGKIADTPQGRWLGEWSGNVEVAARNFTKSANDQGKVPLFIAYNIPNRDCGQHSAGGATQADEYRAWIRALASAITAEGRAIVVLEPDALGH